MKFSPNNLSFLADSPQVLVFIIAYEYKPTGNYNHVCSFARILAHIEELEHSFTFQ